MSSSRIKGLNDDGRKKDTYTEITLATWNVQTMLKPGRMKEIMGEIGKVRVDVVAVQEIQDAQKDLHSRIGRDKKKGKTQ